jgi:hypothetical protein
MEAKPEPTDLIYILPVAVWLLLDEVREFGIAVPTRRLGFANPFRSQQSRNRATRLGAAGF